MFIKTLELSNFRNYEDLKLTFCPNMNVIYGDNGQGKTNILEAIYVMATSKSHRSNYHKDMMKMGEDETHIKGLIQHNYHETIIDVHYGPLQQKNIAINHQSIKKMSELFGTINVIMFSPEDLGIIKSGPAIRRKFMDVELCQMDKIYLNDLKMYHHIHKQRNHLLKQIFKQEVPMDQLDIWDPQLIYYGKRVIEKRKIFINELNPIYEKIHYHLSGQRDLAKIIYEHHVEAIFFEEKLIKRRGYDIKTGTTSVGPHRDDIGFLLDDMDIRQYGSQGQQRTAALSLKLSEIELVKLVMEEMPILLLDDVLSELDAHRQAHLMTYLEDIQTFMTCTGNIDMEKVIIDQCPSFNLYHIHQGKLI